MQPVDTFDLCLRPANLVPMGPCLIQRMSAPESIKQLPLWTRNHTEGLVFPEARRKQPFALPPTTSQRRLCRHPTTEALTEATMLSCDKATERPHPNELVSRRSRICCPNGMHSSATWHHNQTRECPTFMHRFLSNIISQNNFRIGQPVCLFGPLGPSNGTKPRKLYRSKT
jgi:hypothetical protein